MEGLHARSGHDWGAPNLDALAFFYISFAILYSIVLALALVILYCYRHTTAVRLRGYASICWTVLFLHVYLVLILLAYPLNGRYKCGVEFWIMSTFLPFSIALFQASNIRLLSCYEEQRQLAHTCYIDDPKENRRPRREKSFSGWWARLSTVEQTHTCIIAGLVVQLIVSLVLYFGSRRFHSSYGLFSEYVSAGQCRRGLEWIPSVFWQFLWSTVFGPYVLVKIRHIHDTHFWAWQTRLAVIACLPGTPLWLLFVYADSPTIAEINKWFIPAGWFLPGLFTMQFVSIFFPLLDAHKNRSAKSALDVPIPPRKDDTPAAPGGTRPRDIYSMASLEMQINKNLDPLLRWAAEKEFTAENIVFLRAVRDFKRKWENISKRDNHMTQIQQRERFEDAAYIWFKLVNPLTARFNINIDYRTYSELEQMFSGLRYEPFDDSESTSNKSSTKSDNVVAPWMDAEKETPRSPSPTSTSPTSTSEDRIAMSDIDKLYQIPITEISARRAESFDHAEHPYEVPAHFGLEIFDKAYETVKNDVFLNTWVRYEARFSRPHDPSANVPFRESICAKVSKPPSIFRRTANRLFGHFGRRAN